VKPRAIVASLLIVAFAGALPLACARALRAANPSLEDLPEIALRARGAARDEPIARLRALGPEGLWLALGHADAQAAARLLPNGVPAISPEVSERVREAIDRVAGQRDALASRLFWFEDLELAGQEGRALESWSIEHERYPVVSSVAELVPLLEPTYVKALPRVDGWGRPIEVASNGREYVIASRGGDGLWEPASSPRRPNGGTDDYSLVEIARGWFR